MGKEAAEGLGWAGRVPLQSEAARPGGCAGRPHSWPGDYGYLSRQQGGNSRAGGEVVHHAEAGGSRIQVSGSISNH